MLTPQPAGAMSDRIAPQALARLLKLARALAAAVEKAGGFEALAVAQCDVLQSRLWWHMPWLPQRQDLVYHSGPGASAWLRSGGLS